MHYDRQFSWKLLSKDINAEREMWVEYEGSSSEGAKGKLFLENPLNCNDLGMILHKYELKILKELFFSYS